jgi:hypothetical protein
MAGMAGSRFHRTRSAGALVALLGWLLLQAFASLRENGTMPSGSHCRRLSYALQCPGRGMVRAAAEHRPPVAARALRLYGAMQARLDAMDSAAYVEPLAMCGVCRGPRAREQMFGGQQLQEALVAAGGRPLPSPLGSCSQSSECRGVPPAGPAAVAEGSAGRTRALVEA